MLLEFSCSNFKSIMDKVTLSFLGSKDDTNEKELKFFSNVHVLRSAIIYGPNGSGKSNFLSALGFMQQLVIMSMNNQPGDSIDQNSNKIKTDKNPSDFSIQFVKNNIRFAYGFSIKDKIIIEEYLYFFPKEKQIKIFERTMDDIKPGDKYKKSFQLSVDALKDNRLFLSCAANLTSIKEIEEAFLFFKEDIVYYNPELNNWIEYSMKLICDNEKNKKDFMKVLEALGTGIKDISPKFEQVNISMTDLPNHLPEALKSLLVGKGERFSVEVKYEQFDIDLMSEESTGIKKLFEIICPIIDIINHGKILVCDEIESGLHEAIVWEIVSLFKNARMDVFAQFLFTTHDTSLLDSKLFRRDQIWFTELNEDRATDLYSLSEIRNVRKTENLRNGYVLGKYRAMPMISANVHSLLKDD